MENKTVGLVRVYNAAIGEGLIKPHDKSDTITVSRADVVGGPIRSGDIVIFTLDETKARQCAKLLSTTERMIDPSKPVPVEVKFLKSRQVLTFDRNGHEIVELQARDINITQWVHIAFDAGYDLSFVRYT